ncbi:hypothetical protein M153_21530001462 [Pseudoloma neurophilia]|uniref:Uncharacterized protein n=1 Tax=Pseudoloma neurophilia TaxID=146866 RepID=A0A0R0LUE0_9MICR|nr:hypothetical protein M153_21530001462 [Pseudoloma neurophilia]
MKTFQSIFFAVETILSGYLLCLLIQKFEVQQLLNFRHSLRRNCKVQEKSNSWVIDSSIFYIFEKNSFFRIYHNFQKKYCYPKNFQ